MEKRPKAQDIFNESNFVFVEKVKFTEAFPELDYWRIELEESDSGITPQREAIYETPDALGEYVNCTAELCYNGGFRIGEILRDMVRKKDVEREFSGVCQGYWGSPKGRERYKPCPRYFRGKINLKYNK